MRWRLRVLEILAQQREQHGVLPLARAQVRLALRALADEAGPLRVRDRSLVRDVEPDRPRTLAVDLDHEPAVQLRLALGALDLGEHVLDRRRSAAAEIGPHLLGGDQVEQEVRVVTAGATDLDPTHDAWDATRRRRSLPAPTAPVPSATPPRIRASPPYADAPKRSPRKIAP